jgi:ADP-heptose:LPS heptosyltransferase
MSLRTECLKFADAAVGASLCRILGRVTFWTSRAEPPHVPPAEIRRILVIRPGGMGDMLLLLPVIRALRGRFPQAEVELVCEQRNFPVLRVAGMDNRSLRYDARPLAVLWRLAVRRYDVVIDTEQFHHFSAVLAWLSRARMRVGFKINPRRNPLYTHLVNYAPDGPEGSQFA